MKVAIVGPSETFKSGISAFSDRLADAFARAGHDTWYIPIRRLLPRFLFPGRERVPPPQDQAALAQDGHRYRFGPPLDYHDPRTVAAARRFVAERGFDLAVVAWWTGAAAHMTVPVARAARKAGAWVVLDVHEVRDPLEERRALVRAYSRVAFRRMARSADIAVVHANSMGERVVDEAPWLAGRVRTVPHPVYDHYGPLLQRAAALRRLGLPPDAFVVLSFGLVRAYKGVPDLVRSLAKLPPRLRDRAHLLVVGEQWEGRAELDAALASSPLRERVHLVREYVPDAQVPLYFSAADVVALPYRRAAQSGVLQVAMAFGAPVVVSDAGGLPDAVQGYPWKATCRAGDPASIARAIAEAMWRRESGESYVPYRWDDAVREIATLAAPAASEARPPAARG